MDNIGDIIYLIIMALIFIAGAANAESKKKKKAQEKKKAQQRREESGVPIPAEPEPKQRSTIPSLEDILREFTDEPVPAKKVVPAPAPATLPKSKPFPDRTFVASKPTIFDNSKEGVSSLAMSSLMLLEDEPPMLIDDLEFDNKDELRKAIIYSEIINRRY